MEPQLKTLERTSIIPGTINDVIEFHRNPKALLWLTPPPIVVQIIRDERRSLVEGEVEFNLWLGPLPVRWLARHEPGPIATSFTDWMVKGPMAAWRHDHIFRPVSNGVELTDRISFKHNSGWKGLLTHLIFDGLPLRFLLFYRHWRTRRAVAAQGRRGLTGLPMTLLFAIIIALVIAIRSRH